MLHFRRIAYNFYMSSISSRSAAVLGSLIFFSYLPLLASDSDVESAFVCDSPRPARLRDHVLGLARNVFFLSKNLRENRPKFSCRGTGKKYYQKKLRSSPAENPVAWKKEGGLGVTGSPSVVVI